MNKTGRELALVQPTFLGGSGHIKKQAISHKDDGDERMMGATWTG